MSGIVAVISRDPDVLGRGPAMLARLRHLPRYQIATLAVDGAWLGVCGWPAGIAAAGGRGDAGEASVVVCGEFLNAAELRRELRLPHAANAAEIALAAYRRWDDDLFAHLDGVYALALHDAASRWTLAGVDPNTVAVLQAVEIAGDVLVASEAKAFLCDPRFQPRLDELTCATLLALEAMIDGRSLFAGVEGLANGRHFEAHGGSIATVRHWDPREVAGGSLRGEPYLDHLAAAMGELSGPLFAGDDLLLPLTGGLDSRLLCAAAPAAADPLALTFGSALDPDVRRAAQMARARGLRHVVFGLEDDYLPRYGDGTVWLTEGRHNPATNFSGGQMDKVGECRFLVSGHFGELGRSTLRGDRLVPNWAMLEAGARDFERRYLSDMVRPSLPAEYWPALLGRRGPEMLQNAYDEVARKLAETRGLPVPDRLDIAMTEMRFHSCRAGLLYSSFWVDERAVPEPPLDGGGVRRHARGAARRLRPPAPDQAPGRAPGARALGAVASAAARQRVRRVGPRRRCPGPARAASRCCGVAGGRGVGSPARRQPACLGEAADLRRRRAPRRVAAGPGTGVRRGRPPFRTAR